MDNDEIERSENDKDESISKNGNQVKVRDTRLTIGHYPI
jgi:hypothetical protein